MQALQANPKPGILPLVSNEKSDVKRLGLKVLEAERMELERLRQRATIHDEVFFQLVHEFDLEEESLRVQGI